MDDTRRIALAVNAGDPHPNHQAVFAGVMEYARERGNWECFIDEHPLVQAGKRRKARGVYHGVIARANPAMRKLAKARGIPLVSTLYQHHGQGVAGVYLDPMSMGLVAAEHLIDRGFSRFQLFYNDASRHHEHVFSACVDRLEKDGVAYEINRFPDGDTDDSEFWIRMEQRVVELIDVLEPPVAIFIDSAVIARMLVELCKHRGLHVPQDVAVLSLRNPEQLLEIPVSISAIQDNYHRVGFEAAKLLDSLMDDEPIPSKPILIKSPGVVARASTDYFAVDDSLVAQALQYMSTHLKEKIYVEDIADALGVSPPTLYSRFEAALGRTLGDEIRRLRTSMVRVMLTDKNLGLKEIAKRAGFGSTDVMSRSFKAAFGTSPGAYRKQQDQAKP